MTPIYYTLKQLEEYEFTDLRYRMIKYRFKQLITEGKIKQGKNAYKKNNKWHINVSVIDLFQAKRKLVTHKKIHYKNEITINFDSNYDVHFHHYIGYWILSRLDPHHSLYRIEASANNDRYHIHLGTTASKDNIYDILNEIEDALRLNIINNKNTHVSEICNNALFYSYINKAVVYK